MRCDLSTWERAEIARSEKDAAALAGTDLHLSFKSQQRYYAPAADTVPTRKPLPADSLRFPTLSISLRSVMPIVVSVRGRRSCARNASLTWTVASPVSAFTSMLCTSAGKSAESKDAPKWNASRPSTSRASGPAGRG